MDPKHNLSERRPIIGKKGTFAGPVFVLNTVQMSINPGYTYKLVRNSISYYQSFVYFPGILLCEQFI